MQRPWGAAAMTLHEVPKLKLSTEHLAHACQRHDGNSAQVVAQQGCDPTKRNDPQSDLRRNQQHRVMLGLAGYVGRVTS